MPQNETRFYIHHYVDGGWNLHLGMICCIVLGVVVVILLILLAIAVYAIIASKKARHSRINPSRTASKHSRRHLMDDASNTTDSPASSRRNVAPQVHFSPISNTQHIPLSTFRKNTKSKAKIGADSSESSAGLYDVLFPEKYNGEIIRENPTVLMNFAGQVHPPDKKLSHNNPNAGPSCSAENMDNKSESLDWDYFQQNLQFHEHAESVCTSEIDSEIDPNNIKTICWV